MLQRRRIFLRFPVGEPVLPEKILSREFAWSLRLLTEENIEGVHGQTQPNSDSWSN